MEIREREKGMEDGWRFFYKERIGWLCRQLVVEVEKGRWRGEGGWKRRFAHLLYVGNGLEYWFGAVGTDRLALWILWADVARVRYFGLISFAAVYDLKRKVWSSICNLGLSSVQQSYKPRR